MLFESLYINNMCVYLFVIYLFMMFFIVVSIFLISFLIGFDFVNFIDDDKR